MEHVWVLLSTTSRAPSFESHYVFWLFFCTCIYCDDSCSLLILLWLLILDSLLLHGHTAPVFRRLNSCFLAVVPTFIQILLEIPSRATFSIISNQLTTIQTSHSSQLPSYRHGIYPCLVPWIIENANPPCQKSIFRVLFSHRDWILALRTICITETLVFSLGPRKSVKDS